jgi:predicted DCC family thiol-disulfide oxidoreductase YuxK
VTDRIPPRRGAFVFDGDCGFCTSTITVLSRFVAPDVDYLPWQRQDLARLALTIEQVEREVWWLHPAETRAGGARAFARLLRRGRRPWPLLGRLVETWPVVLLAERAYRWVARNRHSLPGGTPACALGRAEDDRRRSS